MASEVSDAALGEVRRQLEYKTEWAGKQLVIVDRWYPSSQTCGECGYVNSDVRDLRIRKWKCPECGEVHDRDCNAAVNILREGERIIGSRRPEYKPVESPTVDDRQQAGLRSGGSVKQEVET